MAGYFFNDEMTPQAIDAKRELIRALSKDNLSAAPVGHWTAALARVLGAGADQYETAKLNEADVKGSKDWVAAFTKSLGGAASPPAPSAGAALPASQPAPATPQSAPLAPPQPGPPMASDGTPMPPIRPASLGGQGAPSMMAAADVPLSNMSPISGSSPVLPSGSFSGGAAPAIASALGNGQPVNVPPGAPPGTPKVAMNPGGNIGQRLVGDLQRDFGLTPQQAAGFAGNLAHESGGFKSLQEINPLVPGSRGGFGYAQWTGPRRVAFEQYAQANGLDPKSYEANYGFLKHELTNTPEGAVIPQLKQAGSVGEATQVVSDQFLRPGIPHMGSRMQLAQALASGNGPSTQTDAGSPAPGAAQAQFNVPGAPAQSGSTPQAAALLQALSSPWAARNPMLAQLGQKVLGEQLTGNKLTYQTLPDGTILALDPTGRRPPTPVYQAQTKPNYGVIGKDEFGNEKYGWINPVTQQVTPGPSQASQQPGQASPAAAIPPAPPGVDPKKWREILSTRAAEDIAPPKSSEVAELRKEVLQLPSYKNLAQAAPIYQPMFKTAGTNSKASDLNLVYGLGKIMDPTSVVREGEMIMVKNTASLPDWLVGAANSLNGGQALTPETRAAILKEAHNRVTSYQEQFNNDSAHYQGIAGRNKMRTEDVIPSFGEFKPWEAPKAPSQGATPSMQPSPLSPTPQQQTRPPVKVNTPEEARKLPKGTPFIIPDGRQGVAQ